MAKRKMKRKHEVDAELSNFQLAKAKSALTLVIYTRSEKVGRLKVGRGSLYWWGRNRKESKRVGWSKFTAMMNTLAYGDAGE